MVVDSFVLFFHELQNFIATFSARQTSLVIFKQSTQQPVKISYQPKCLKEKEKNTVCVIKTSEICVVASVKSDVTKTTLKNCLNTRFICSEKFELYELANYSCHIPLATKLFVLCLIGH
jgi:hypothetical protein